MTEGNEGIYKKKKKNSREIEKKRSKLIFASITRVTLRSKVFATNVDPRDPSLCETTTNFLVSHLLACATPTERPFLLELYIYIVCLEGGN